MAFAASDAGRALTDEGEKLFDLFRLPAGRSRPRPDERAVMERAQVEELSVAGRTVTGYRWGDGQRPVLLVHGWESRASRFAKIIERLLERGCSLVAFDAPGHGESAGTTTDLVQYRDVIVELHRRHGDFDAVVAHSFGVMATFFSMPFGVRARRMAAISSVPGFDYLIDVYRTKMQLDDDAVDELRYRIQWQLYPGEADIWLNSSVPHRARGLDMPMLVIHDEDDRAIDVSQATVVADAFGDRARLVTTRRYGHQRILGSSQVVDEVDRFLAADAALPVPENGVAPR